MYQMTMWKGSLVNEATENNQLLSAVLNCMVIFSSLSSCLGNSFLVNSALKEQTALVSEVAQKRHSRLPARTKQKAGRITSYLVNVVEHLATREPDTVFPSGAGAAGDKEQGWKKKDENRTWSCGHKHDSKWVIMLLFAWGLSEVRSTVPQCKRLNVRFKKNLNKPAFKLLFKWPTHFLYFTWSEDSWEDVFVVLRTKNHLDAVSRLFYQISLWSTRNNRSASQS